MNHINHEAIVSLVNLIKSSHQKRENHYREHLALDAENLWNASMFFSKILHKASADYSFNYEEFAEFKLNFETEYKFTVNDSSLFKKYWLRNVFGTIKIAAAIESFCHTFDEIIQYKEELEFLIKFQENHKPAKFESNRKFEKTYLQDQISQYKKSNGISLNEKGIFFNRWSREVEGKIEFSDMEAYFKPYIENWNDFIFINRLKKHLRAKNKITIKISDFNKLHTFHKKTYPNTPSKQNFIDQELLRQSDKVYKIDFFNSKPRYWSQLENKISGYLWQLLLDDSSFKNDYERLGNWVFKITYWEAWPNPFKYIATNSKKRLLNSAFTTVINEKDLEGCENEYNKIKLEGENSREIYVLSEKALIFDKEFTLKNDNLFEVLESLNLWEKNAKTTYLHDQSSRNNLGFLIHLIVLEDEEFFKVENDIDEDNFEIKNYRRIKELLRVGINKPYLVWKVSNCIKSYRPEIIPYLLIEDDFCSLSFLLIDELEYNSYHKNYFKSKVWIETVTSALKNCVKANYSKKKISKIIFELFKILNKDKYNFNYQNNFDENYDFQLVNLIENFKTEVKYHTVFKNDYLFPQIFKELSVLFINLESNTTYRNGIIRFPMLQWDGIFWLLKISTYWKYKDILTSLHIELDELVDKFNESYIQTIETKEISKYNFFENKEEKGTPLWSEKIEKIGLLDWIYPIYYMHEKGDLNTFLTPRLKISKEKDIYDEQNRFVVNKLRTHIGVLLQLLKRIIETTTPYSFEESKVLEIKNRIENQIIDYIKTYSKDDVENGHIDIFSYSHESQFQTSEKEALLPQLARAINWFSDKEKIIDVIANHGDLSKILILLENVTSEGTKKTLLSKIKGLEIRKFLEEYKWLPEIQNILLKVSSYPELIIQTEEAVKYWEKEILKRRNEKAYKELLLKTKLLLAYFKNDLNQINSIELPEKESFYNSNELAYLDYKRFYTALFFIQSNPQKSYDIFNDLVKKNSNYYSFALNRLVAKVNWAEVENNKDLYFEAYEEWKEYKEIDDEANIILLDKTESITILDILNKLDKNEQIEKAYQNLELPIKMNPDVLKIKINNLIKQKKIDEALILKDKAKKYHQYASELELDFISELELLISGVDNIDELKGFFYKILSSEPSKLVKILPENINGKEILNEFIVNEVIIASDKMLEKIKSISEIGNEDKYNDILEVLLDARINTWGWSVGAQSRGAFSAPKDGSNGLQPGERDLPIMNRNKQAIQICEAFIYRGANTAKQHIKKLFDYHHKKEAMTIIIYDTGQVNGKTFEMNWEDYKKNIVSKVNYPTGFEFDKISDVTSDYKMKLSAIKIANSNHKSGTIIHHIFININYKTT